MSHTSRFHAVRRSGRSALSIGLAVFLVASGALLGPMESARAFSDVFTWTTKADFEENASTVGLPTTRQDVSTADQPGDVVLSEAMIAVSAGAEHTLGLLSDGTARAKGSDGFGQVHPVALWTDIVAISAGAYHSVGLESDGTVVAAGMATQGQLGVVGWTDVTAISAGGFHTVGLKANGTVVAAGRNVDGQCNVTGWTDIVAISAGAEHTVGLKRDGTVVATGLNTDGQCNVSSWTGITAISAGGYHTLALRSNQTVAATGKNTEGQCDVSSKAWANIVAISAGGNHSLGVRSNGTVAAAGQSSFGQLGVSGWTDVEAVSGGLYHSVGLRSDGAAVATGLNTSGQCDVARLVAAVAGGYHTLGLRADGTVVGVGRNTDGQLNVSGWTDIVAVAAGPRHSVGVKSDGTVVAVGFNDFGQLNVSGWTDIVAVAAGQNHTVGLRANGTVVTAGSNDQGQRDNVSGWSGIIAIAAGAYHTVGLTDAQVFAEGSNADGQTDVSAWTEIVAVAAGITHTVGLKSNGTVVAVGNNDFGQCDVTGWTDVVSVAASTGNTVGLRADGTGVVAGFSLLNNVAGWTDVVAVSAGMGHAIGLRSDGTLTDEGNGADGQRDVAGWRSFGACAPSGTIGGEGASIGLRLDAGWPVFGGAVDANFENLAPGEAVKFAMRTSSDNMTWSVPLGRDGEPIVWSGAGANYFGKEAGDFRWYRDLSELPPSRYRDIVVRLEGSGATTPVLESVQWFAGTPWPTIEVQHNYSGVVFDRWVTGYSSAYSGGGYVYGRWTGTELTARFEGGRVRWIGPKQPNYGMADVYIDGALVATNVDCYASAADASLSRVIWESGTLTDAEHTISIRLTGAKNAASTGNYVVVDRFEVDGLAAKGGGVRYDEQDGVFTGSWLPYVNLTYYDTTYTYSRWTNATFTLAFSGTKVSWIGPRTPNYGMADVYIDGVKVATVDQYRANLATQGWREVVWESATLSPGSHTLEIKPLGTKNPAATDYNVVIDAFDVR